MFSPSVLADEADGLGATVIAEHAHVIWLLGLGFLLGVKHALDADHLVAIATIIGEGTGLLRSSLVGALWGVGHTLALLCVGVVVIALGVTIPQKLALAMEFGVAIMLIGLGLNVVRKLLKGGTVHTHAHEHDGHIHVHAHVHEPGAEGVPGHHALSRAYLRVRNAVRKDKRSLVVGMIHGLAGSAALMLIVLATIQTPGVALAYVGVFGLGSMGGMFLMTTMMILPFVFGVRRAGHAQLIFRSLAGVVSIVFGVAMGWQIGFAEGLFF